MAKLKSYLTPVELAERWQISVSHLANMRSAETGPDYFKVGRQVRYSVETIVEYEKRNTVKTS